MSITLKAHPAGYSSAHGDLLFVVYEATHATDPVTYTDYKYIAYVYIGSSATPVARLLRVPRPDNKMGVFNIGDIVRNYVSSVFNPAANTLVAQETGENEFFVNATLHFAEEYNGSEYPALDSDRVADTQRTYFNHYNGRLIGNTTNLFTYTNKVVSARPQANYINTGDAFCLLPYFPTSTGSVAIQVKAYAGSTLQGIYNGTITPSAANNLQMLNVAPNAINASAGTLINSNTTHYTVQVNSGTIYTFTLTCESVYTNYTLHFLNRFGGFESRSFSKVSRKTIDITKTDFGRLPYTIDASGNVNYYSSNNVYNETRSTYASQYKEKMVLNTDILTDEEYLWLSDLILSPLVYMEMNGYFIPVAVTGNNYEFKKRVNDKLTNLTLNIEFGEQFNAQFR